MLIELTVCVTIVWFLITERITNAAAWITMRRVTGVKQYAGVQVLGSGISFVTTMTAGVVSVAVRTLTILMTFAFWGILVSTFLCVLYVVHERKPGVLIWGVHFWNDVVGPAYSQFVLAPIWAVDKLASGVIPVWNGGWFMVTKAASEIGIMTLLRTHGEVMTISTDIFDISRSVTFSTVAYVGTISKGCNPQQQLACYNEGLRMLDIITPMAHLKRLLQPISMIFLGLCGGITGPFDILTYPLRDINFAKGLHGIVNSILYAIIQVPFVTAERCKFSDGLLVFCVPDFEPVFNMMTMGLRSMGIMLDNWLDITSVIVERSLNISSVPDCDKIPLGMTPFNRSNDTFRDNQTVIVGLTEGLYAITIFQPL